MDVFFSMSDMKISNYVCIGNLSIKKYIYKVVEKEPYLKKPYIEHSQTHIFNGK